MVISGTGPTQPPSGGANPQWQQDLNAYYSDLKAKNLAQAIKDLQALLQDSGRPPYLTDDNINATIGNLQKAEGQPYPQNLMYLDQCPQDVSGWDMLSYTSAMNNWTQNPEDNSYGDEAIAALNRLEQDGVYPSSVIGTVIGEIQQAQGQSSINARELDISNINMTFPPFGSA